jgi:hypothetical protein
MFYRIAACILAVAAVAALAASAAAIDKEWTYPGPADWATDEYWSPWGMPGPFDIAKVDISMGTPTINILGEYACDELYLGSTMGGQGQWRLEQGVFRASAEYIGYEANSFCWAWQIGGSNLVTGTFAIGNGAGSWGHYYMGTSAVALQAAAIFVGAAGTGSLNQNAGAVTTGMLLIAAAPGSEGTYWLGGGTLDTTGGIASAGNSTLIMAGGTLNTYGSSITLTNFYVGDDINSPASHALSGDVVIGTEKIGRRASGTVTQNTGTHRVTSLLTLGIEAEGNGTLNLGGGNLDTATVTVGTAGTGRIVHSAGRHTVATTLDIGNGAGSGTYDLSGTGILDPAVIRVGNGGTGTFNQTGGTVSFLGDIYISAVPGGEGGTYNLGGTGHLYAPNVYVGYASSGWFNQTGGTADLQTKLHVGYGGGQGIYRMAGGTLAVPEIQVGNVLSTTGCFEWFGGTVDTPLLHVDNGTLEMGFNFNVADLLSGDLLLSGGNITGLTQNQLGVTNGATAVHSGTTSAMLGMLAVGSWNGAGTYNLGGNATLAVNGLALGWGGTTGTFNQTGGTATVADTLDVGMYGDGTYNLSDGSLTANFVNIGTEGTGVFNQSGGRLVVSTKLKVGD